MTAKDITPDDPFGYKADRLRIEAEDNEAAELLAGMMAAEPERHVRELLAGIRGEELLREMLIPPDGPYDPEDLEIIHDEN